MVAGEDQGQSFQQDATSSSPSASASGLQMTLLSMRKGRKDEKRSFLSSFITPSLSPSRCISAGHPGWGKTVAGEGEEG